MLATPTNIPSTFSFPATPRTPRPPRKTSINLNTLYTPTGSTKAARHPERPSEPLPPITAADRTGPERELYRGRGQMDPDYVFSKPPRAQRPCRPSEKHSPPRPKVKQHYPLCTSPGVKMNHAEPLPVSDEPEMKQ